VSSFVWRVLDRTPCPDLDAYVAAGGGDGLDAARRVDPEALIAEVAASGLRGRGGAGFPTGLKWRTVRASVPAGDPVPVVVNGAEGEPGTFKDRAIIRTNPFRVVEGALIAAIAMGADEVTLAVKSTFDQEIRRLTEAVQAVEAAGWSDGIRIRLSGGPAAYLFGEETAMLEVLDGRQPFPRVAPPYRRGVDESKVEGVAGGGVNVTEAGDDVPALVDNVETIANIPAIVAHGADAFRAVGTETTPGTLVCTITGDTLRHGVAEVPAGTPLRAVVDEVGGGLDAERRILGVLCGVSGPVITPDLLDLPLDHEAMAAAGVSLGSCGFIVVDDRHDPVAVAQGVARFLSVESCGQCEPCKRDGLAVSRLLGDLVDGVGGAAAIDGVRDRLSTVADGARCNLARQTEAVTASFLAAFGDRFARRAATEAPVEPYAVAPIVDIAGERAVLDQTQLTRQPDWSHGRTDSGVWPAQRLADTPVDVRVPADEPTDAVGAGVGHGVGQRGDRPVAAPAVDPFEAIGRAHVAVERLLQRLGNHRDDPAVRGQVETSLRDLVDVSTRILTPMARRCAGARGDDAAWAVEGHDRALVDAAHHLADGSAASADDVADLEASFRRHVQLEDALLDLLRDSMDETQMADLGAAVGEAQAEVGEHTVPTRS
jgi:NADH:ubiquinone oxidoreductase subunit F (NADH-binding)